MTPGIGLAAFESAVTSVNLLVWIIKTSSEVVRFKATCQKIGQLAGAIMSALQQNRAALEKQRSFGLMNKLLRDLGAFLVRCTFESNAIQWTWEIIWTKRLPKMLAELERYTLYLIMETTAETRTAVARQLTMVTDIDTTLQRIEFNTDQMIENDAQAVTRNDLDHLIAVINEKYTSSTGVSSSDIVSFRVNDGRFQPLDLVSNSPPCLSATLDGAHVVCVPSLTANAYGSSRIPKLVRIYSKISALILVQPFYGIAEMNNEHSRHWAVLQDLSAYQTLGQAVRAQALPPSVHNRLKIAYELSKTLAYLHSVEIVAKSMSDATIVMRATNSDGGESFEPVLTDLEEAREFLEHTSGRPYDIRYEAPEYAQTSTHSPKTDVWCLGMLIMEIMMATPPFGQAQPIFKDDADATALLRERIRVYDFQREHAQLLTSDGLISSVAKVVQSCLAAPSRRPSAAWVTEQLFGVWLSDVVQTTPDILQAEVAKSAVASALELHAAQEAGSSTNVLNATSIDAVHWTSLDEARLAGDPVASALIGQAFWRGLRIPVDEGSQVMLAKRGDRAQVVRARAAQSALELAFDGGILDVAKDLRDIHACLGRAYRDINQ